jgi:transketolase
VLDDFSSELPLQYINAGVAEQNMTGLAAGLALEGKNVFTYSIANFPTLRCLEQIRNDVAYHEASVNIVAIGGGFSYGALGMSHHATEDVAILRALPGLRVFAPCDDAEAVAVVKHMVEAPAPTYLRLDKSKVGPGICEPALPGRLRRLRAGVDVAIVGYGGILAVALEAAQLVADEGLACSVYSAHSLKPFDAGALLEIARAHAAVVTVEEHVATGGLGSLAADVFAGSAQLPRRLVRLALPDAYSAIVGSQDYLRMRHGLDAQAIAACLRRLKEAP